MISIVLPSLNEGDKLHRTINGMLPVLPNDAEIIVVDNGSTDGSTDKLPNDRRFNKSPHNNVKLIQYDHPIGAAAARNQGATFAKNDIIIFCDAHIDVAHEWWIPLVRKLQNPKVGIVGSGIGSMDDENGPIRYGQRLVADPTLRPEWLHKAESRQVCNLGAGCFAMRKETWQNLKFDEGMPMMQFEDTELCIRAWLMGYEVWVAHESVIFHYFRTEAPYDTDMTHVWYNMLRLAYLHFNDERLGRVIAGLRGQGSMALVKLMLDPDLMELRYKYHQKRVHDDTWLFNKFRGECEV